MNSSQHHDEMLGIEMMDKHLTDSCPTLDYVRLFLQGLVACLCQAMMSAAQPSISSMCDLSIVQTYQPES